MKTNIRLILVVAIIILSVTALIAQTKDIVYLKNGSVIKGTILEMVPDKTIKVQTADGNIFVYNMSEVEKISKEAAAPAPSNEPKPFIEQRGNENQRSYENQVLHLECSLSGGFIAVFPRPCRQTRTAPLPCRRL